MNQQVDPKTIEALKVARNQVMQAPYQSPALEQVRYGAGKHGAGQAQHNKFAEEFIQKMASIEKETAKIDEEMAKVEKLWSSLVEKKKQLEARRNELIKVKDKITTLNKEMDDVLSKELGVRNYLVV